MHHAEQRYKNFNGRYGCNNCEIKTKKCRTVEGKKRIRIYPFINDKVALRTGENMQKQGKKAANGILLLRA